MSKVNSLNETLPRGRSSGLVKTLYGPTPTVHPPPRRRTRKKTLKVGRVSLKKARRCKWESERNRKLLTHTNPPLLRFRALVNQSSTFWLFLWYDTAGRWAKTATSAFRGKTSQLLCLHTEPLALALHSQTESKRKGSLVSYSCRKQLPACFVSPSRSSLL